MTAVSRALVWLERALLVTGLFLAAWSALLWTERQYVTLLPVPTEVRALPGDRRHTFATGQIREYRDRGTS